MKEYGTPKPLAEMSKEERLTLGAKLIEARGQLQETRTALTGKPPLADANVYDVLVYCPHKGDFAEVREFTLSASDSEGYDSEMRAAGLARCQRLRQFICDLIDERLSEIAQKLDAL